MTSTEHITTFRKNLKRRAVDYLGSSCKVCGYNKCLAALEFHHLDPKEKDFQISDVYRNPRKWEDVVIELNKCILVCANCHREIHQGLVEIFNSTIYNTEKDYRLVEGTHHKCGNKKCNNIIILSKQFCSTECNFESKQRHDWLAIKDEVIYKRDILKRTYKSIGTDYGVSDNTLRRWYLKF